MGDTQQLDARDQVARLAPWLAGVPTLAGVVGLIGGTVAVVGLLARTAGRAG